MSYRIPIYRVTLVREGSLSQLDRPVVRHSVHAEEIVRAYLGEDLDREHFVVMMLNAKNRVTGVSTVSIGSLTSSLVHPREVLKVVVQGNAASVILAHNHPSGEPSPSQEDKAITRRLRELLDILGVKLLDHIILGDDRRYYSFADDGGFACW